jgi:quercetin dioxygenase-like cupin family protein
MFGINSSDGYQDILNGIKIKAVNFGENTIMTEFLLQKGSVLPEHSHINEQTGYLIKGSLRLYIDGVSKELRPGDSWNIGKDIKHKAEIFENSVVIEVFTPTREEYFKYIYDKDIVK